MSSEGLTTQTNASNQIALINENMTGPPAEALLENCGLLHSRPDASTSLNLLDNCTGIGTLIFRLLKHKPNLTFESLIGADLDENYLSFLRERATKSGHANIRTCRLDQQAPGLGDNSLDYIFNNFGVFFAPRDTDVLTETHRLLKPGGTAGFTSWAKLAWWDEILVPALDRYLPDAPALPHPSNAFPAEGWNDPEITRVKLQNAGFVDAEANVWSFTPEISADDFAIAGAHLAKAISARAWNESARTKYESLIERALRDYLYDSFEGGRWSGKMSAVLTWGRKK